MSNDSVTEHPLHVKVARDGGNVWHFSYYHIEAYFMLRKSGWICIHHFESIAHAYHGMFGLRKEVVYMDSPDWSCRPALESG
jgi:hypothetical protein